MLTAAVRGMYQSPSHFQHTLRCSDESPLSLNCLFAKLSDVIQKTSIGQSSN